MNANVLDHPALEVGDAEERVANISVALREGPCLPLETPTKPKGLGEGMWERKRWKKEIIIIIIIRRKDGNLR